jgi:CubicO group peptidase (beta-lactamase class C family)/D-alanyl-D-alanine dipeptidase
MALFLPITAMAGTVSAAPAIATAAPVTDQDQNARIGQAVSELMAAERDANKHPSMAAAVFDAKGLIWAGVQGTSDADGKQAASMDTVYRAGSISKLFADILLIQLVEAGKIDLDAPVTRYLPDFRPANQYNTPITIRHLLTHSSGLVREPPIGSYFTAGDPGSAAVVSSLNRTSLVAGPGTVTKYSNAGLAVVGRVVEVVSGKSFDDLVREKIFQPAAMDASSFTIATAKDRLAYAEVPYYGAPRRPAPTFDIGLKAAGGLNTTVRDLAAFGSALLRGGVGERGQLLAPSTLESMYHVRKLGADARRDFGLGFIVGKLGEERFVGHSGAIYGFTAELWLLPDRGIGVVAFGTVDGDGAPFRIAKSALEATLAIRENRSLQTSSGEPVALDPATQRNIVGYYADAMGSVIARIIDGRLLIEAPRTAGELVIRDGQIALRGDVGIAENLEVDPAYQWLKVGTRTYRRTLWEKPPLPPKSLAQLFGDYGWDQQFVRVYERDGQPYVNIEGVEYSRMTPVDANSWAFPTDSLLYAREKLVFTRDKSGRGQSISLNGIVFNRLPDHLPIVTDSERSAAQVKIEPLIAAARNASPPVETTPKYKSDLVALATIDPSLKFDIRYAGTNNFLGVPVYSAPVAMLQRPAAEAIKRANARLRKQGYGIIIHDGYRPWYVTKVFWDATPEEGKIFVADPAEGSRHNRGAAVDLSLVDLATGKTVEMPSLYDESSDRSFASFIGGSSRQRWLREMLKDAMEAEGFTVYPYEWWHFDFDGWRNFPIQNVDLNR